jgi:tRNA-specific 2-thiouridylase
MKQKTVKIAVGMSGGVDSSVAAMLLKDKGFSVTGVYLDCWDEPGCATNQDRRDAIKVGMKLKIPMEILDFKQEYRQRVINWFYREIKQGRTPNPDVVCNREIKFGLFFNWAMSQGFDYLATGHYARIGEANSKLLEAVDKKKDQTYFLYNLKQAQLAKILFPIGAMAKTKLRQLAKKRGLPNWSKKDSVGICFIGKRLSFEEFLKKRVKPHPGEVLNTKGGLIGQHKGVEFYTVGQRHGFDTNSKLKTQNSKPLYVLSKNIKTNQLVVGEKKYLEKKEFKLKDLSLINPRSEILGSGLVCRIRHQGRLIACRLKKLAKGEYRVRLAKPELGVAEGQICVLYRNEECLGGGEIA